MEEDKLKERELKIYPKPSEVQKKKFLIISP